MSGENWESLITEKGFMRVPRALRLKRAELGITNNEYTILLDYVDYYSFSGTINPYRHLTEVSGMNERSVRRILTSLENKGLLKRVVNQHGNGRTKGVVFSIAPLVRRLKNVMKKMSPTVGEEIVPYVGEESVPPNTGEEFNKREEDKNTSAQNADVRARVCDDVRVSKTGVEEYDTVETDYGFIRGTGGPGQEAARNDRQEHKTGQIHLAREAEGPHGPVSGEDDEQIYHPHPGYFGSSVDEPESSTSSAYDVRATNSSLARNCPSREREIVGCRELSGDVNYLREIAPGSVSGAGAVPREPRKDRTGGAGAYSPSRWYNEVWRGLYEEAAGQPALTGGREYKSAETYFRRLRELNPDMEPGEIFVLAGEGAAFMIASQLEGGVFGWMHKPPDICMLASQAQSVEWHLRRIKRSVLERDGNPHPETSSGQAPGPPPEMGRGIVLDGASEEGVGTGSVFVKFIEKIREVQDAGQQIDRVYGELRGIERAARPRALRRGRG